jgi:hypothetical protein
MTIRSTKNRELYVATHTPQNPVQFNDDVEFAFVPATAASIVEDRGTPVIERNDVMTISAGYLATIPGPAASTVTVATELHPATMFQFTNGVAAPQGGYMVPMFLASGHRIDAATSAAGADVYRVVPEACSLTAPVAFAGNVATTDANFTLTPTTCQFVMQAGCGESSVYLGWDAQGTWTMTANANERVQVEFNYHAKRYNSTDFSASSTILASAGISDDGFAADSGDSSVLVKDDGEALQAINAESGTHATFMAQPDAATDWFNSALVAKGMNIELDMYDVGSNGRPVITIQDSNEFTDGIETSFTFDPADTAIEGRNLFVTDENGIAYEQGKDYRVESSNELVFFTPPAGDGATTVLKCHIYELSATSFEIENIGNITFAPGQELEEIVDQNARDSLGISKVNETGYAKLTFQAKDVGALETQVSEGLRKGRLFSAKVEITGNDGSIVRLILPFIQLASVGLSEDGNSFALDLEWNVVKVQADKGNALYALEIQPA